MMNGTWSPRASLYRRLWPRRNELTRPADRLEAALLLVVVTAALVLMPVALAVGSETYADQSRLGQEQSRTRHQTTATLLADARSSSIGVRSETGIAESGVRARWTAPDGTRHTGTVRVADGTKAGSRVPVWLDDTGELAPEPITSEQAAMSGFAIAMGLWVTATGALCTVFLVVRAALNRSRRAAWQREWARVGPGWTRNV